MKPVDCPTCKKHVEPEASTFPFCSERCRLVDLGNWLGGSYRIGSQSDDDPRADEPERDKNDG
jgi:endogenous inhibitor of DNA gyrase (YacG/DUF329 family)